MKTTVNISDSLLRSARQLAAERRTTLTRLIEDGLRLVVEASRAGSEPVFDFPTTRGSRPPTIDPADRRALYNLLDNPT